jgi:hypothetical protein
VRPELYCKRIQLIGKRISAIAKHEEARTLAVVAFKELIKGYEFLLADN